MSWLKVDDGFPEHPKVVCLRDADIGAWLRLACWCARVRNEGTMLREVAVKKVGRATLARLIDARLIDDDGETVTVHDFTAYNPTAEDVEKLRVSRAEAGRRGGLKSGESRQAKPKQLASESEAKPKQTTKQNEAKPEAESNPVPVPVPDASYEASRESAREAHQAKPPGPGLVEVTPSWTPPEELLAAIELSGTPRAFGVEVSLPVFRSHYLGERFAPANLAKAWRTWVTRDWLRSGEAWRSGGGSGPVSGVRSTRREGAPPSHRTETGQIQTRGGQIAVQESACAAKVLQELEFRAAIRHQDRRVIDPWVVEQVQARGFEISWTNIDELAESIVARFPGVEEVLRATA